MSFTDDPYVHVEAFIDGAWVDLPTDFDDDDGGGRISGSAGVTISRGRSAGAQRADAGQCDFVLFNRDGKYSNRNPRSPYFGLLPLNVPVRVKTDPYESHVEMHAEFPGVAVYANDSATLDFTGDMEIRIDYERDHGLQNSFPLLNKYNIGSNARSWFISVEQNNTVTFLWSPDGTSASRRQINSGTAFPTGRQTMRLQFDANNGAGGVTVSFWTGPSLDGPWTLVASQTSAGTSSIFAGTAKTVFGTADEGGLGVGNAFTRHFQGKLFGFRLYNNLSGTVTATGDFSNLEIGATSVSDGTTTWFIEPPAFVGSDSIRFHGVIPRFPIESSANGKDVKSPINAYDITQVLNTSATDLPSPMFRYYSSITDSVGYWPCEDGADSTKIYSPSANVRAGVADSVEFAGESSLAGSQSLIALGEFSKASGRFGAYTDPGEWAMGFSFYIDQTPTADIPYFMTVTTTTGVSVKFTIGTSTYLTEVYNPNGSLNSSNNTLYGTGAEPGAWITVVFELEQSGSNIVWVTNWRGLDPAVGYAHGGTATSLTLGRLSTWAVSGIPTASGVNTAAIGHIIGVKNVDTLLENAHITSFRAYVGETERNRLVRLCDEEGITLRLRGDYSANTKMGPQTAKPLLELLDECAEAGQGVLLARRDSYALEYVSRQELGKYATTTVDYAGGALLNAKADDNLTPTNYVTVTRNNGSSSTKIIETGANSVSAVGQLKDPQTLNLFSDEQPRDIAAWLARIGAWDESRWLDLEFELAKPIVADTDSALYALRALDIMRVILITNPPDWLPIREPEMLIEKYTEVLTRFSYLLTINETSPARPYKVASFVDTGWRVDSTSSTLTSDINASVASFSVSTSSVWGSWKYTSDFYISVSNDKEKMLVTNITGTGPYTFTVTRGTPAFSHSAGATVRLWEQRALGYTFEGV